MTECAMGRVIKDERLPTGECQNEATVLVVIGSDDGDNVPIVVRLCRDCDRLMEERGAYG